LTEIDRIDLAAPAARVWERVRHGALAQSLPIRALFAMRSVASGHTGHGSSSTVRIDNLRSTQERPGFQILVDDPPYEMAVAAIGKVWRLKIPFVHVADANEYPAFAQPGFIKVAWAIRVLPRGEQQTHVELEVRVEATDARSWNRFRRYFRLIGPFSRFIRRSLLRALARDLGAPDTRKERTLPGDDLQAVQLRNLAARAEGRTARDGWRDVREGLCGAWRIAFTLLTPFLRGRREHWELDPLTAARALPGDDLIGKPRWHWTHGIEIDAPAEEVWPWVAQIGADRGGFYSYQWLENLAGCQVRNAETIHPEWEITSDQGLVLHPDVPPLRIVSLERGRYLVAHAPADPSARANGTPWVEASWLFLVEPLGPTRCRFVSRYRVACSNDLATRLSYGPTFVEAIGFAMDRRMLLGVKQRAEASRRRLLAA
jgi:hypothetical protein